jgi:dihydroorotate dehydrogenase electron transfer subunit
VISATSAELLSNKDLGRDNFLLELQAPEIACSCTPGQFVMAWVEEGLNLPFPLLRKALAVYSLPNSERGKITLLIKVVGDGTAKLAGAEPGNTIGLIGPLGNGFETNLSPGKRALIVAGGTGIASVFLLSENLIKNNHPVHLVYGARQAEDLVGLKDFELLSIPSTITTDDGSRGIQGQVTQGLEHYLQQNIAEKSVIYTCGPTPMMRAVSRVAENWGIPCQISVEVKMACGFGVCLGCTVKTRSAYRLACTHGPVFDAADFIWEKTASISELAT